MGEKLRSLPIYDRQLCSNIIKAEHVANIPLPYIVIQTAAITNNATFATNWPVFKYIVNVPSPQKMHTMHASNRSNVSHFYYPTNALNYIKLRD